MKRTMNVLLFIIISSGAIIKTAEQKRVEIPIFGTPTEYKLYFDNAVTEAINTKDLRAIVFLLESENENLKSFRNNYPFAMKLYRILKNNSSEDDFTIEARYIPINSILWTAAALAMKGGNTLFLEKLQKFLDK